MVKHDPPDSLEGSDSSRSWQVVPAQFKYLRNWASQFGLRGLTVYFGEQPPLEKLASKSELTELRTAYETIARRGNVPEITQWCLSISAETPAVDAREEIRGLLLLFERLADRGLSPFTDGRVRYVTPDPTPFNWSVLPSSLHDFEPWLRKFEAILSESELYRYVQDANEDQIRELAAFKELIDRKGELLLAWCQANNVDNNPAENEAFYAEWLFVLVDFAASRIQDRDQSGPQQMPRG